MRRIVIVLCVMALLTGACTSSGSDPSSTAPSNTSGSDGTSQPGGEAPSTTTPGTEPSVSEPPAGDVPPIPLLQPAQSIVEPGDTVVISADPRLAGTVTMTGPDGDVTSAEMVTGEATLSVPVGLRPGSYQLETTGEVSAFGVVSVADGPGVWLSAPEYLMPGEQPEVLVTTYGIPDGMVAALEVATGDGFPERLVPHPLLGLAPVSGTSGEGLPDGTSRWTLPAGFEGDVRVVAASPAQLGIFADDEAGLPYESAVVRVRSCEQPGMITGDLGGRGNVRALWIASGLESESAVTDNGPFALEVRPGTILISVVSETGPTEASSQVLRVKCGETIDVGAGDTPIDTGPTPGEFLDGLTLDDLFTYTSQTSGDLTIDPTGMAECDMSGGVLGVWLNPPDSLEPRLYRLEVDGFDGTGRFEGTFTITDIFTDAASTGTVSIDAELAAIEGIDAVGGAFRGTIDGALGSGSFEVSFTCALFGGLNAARPPTPATVHGVQALAQSVGSSVEACRKGMAMTQSAGGPNVAFMANAISSDLTARLTAGQSRVKWLSKGDVQYILSTEEQRQLFSSDESEVITALSEAMGADFLITVSVRQIEGKWVANVRLLQTEPARLLTGVVVRADGLLDLADEVLDEWRKFKRALKNAAICGKTDKETVSTTKGEQTEVSYQVTDLEGEPVDATVDQVASTCGTFTPETGRTATYRAGDSAPGVQPLNVIGGITGRSTQAGTFTTTFTGEVPGCQDEVTFVARAQGPDGELTTERDAEQSTVAIAIPMFEFKVTIDIEAGNDFLHSESTGQFFIDPDFNQVIGFGTGSTHWEVPDFPCIVISEAGVDERTQLFTGDGTYQVMPVGELASGDVRSSGTVNFIPRGYLSSITVSYSDPDCFPQGTSTNDAFGTAIFGITTFYPDILAGLPPNRGFEMPFTTDGSRTSRTWPFTEGPGSVTVEVWTAGPGNRTG